MHVPSVASIALLLLSGAAFDVEANDVGFYIGAWYGQAEKEGDQSEYDAFAVDVHTFFAYTPITLQNSFDETGDSLALLVGYRINRYLAVEGAYTRLGELSHRSRSSGNFRRDSGTIDVTSESETTGFTFSVLGVIPLSYDWEIYARGGLLFSTNTFKTRLDVRAEIFATVGGERISDSFSEGSDELYAGIGLSRRFFDIYDFRLEYQRVFDAGMEATGGIGDIDVASLGVTVTF
jgi:OOP family OmpA-OmpF porin